MAESNLTKKDIFDFVMLGKKIVVAGTGTVLNAAKSKIAELTVSEEALRKHVSSQIKKLVDSGWTEEEARKAVDERMKARLAKVVENSAKPVGDNVGK